MFNHWVRRCSGSGKYGRGALGLASPSGDGRRGRHILDLRRFHIFRDGRVEGLLHGALGTLWSLRSYKNNAVPKHFRIVNAADAKRVRQRR